MINNQETGSSIHSRTKYNIVNLHVHEKNNSDNLGSLVIRNYRPAPY